MGLLVILGLLALFVVGLVVLTWRIELKHDREIAERFNAALDKVLHEE